MADLLLTAGGPAMLRARGGAGGVPRLGLTLAAVPGALAVQGRAALLRAGVSAKASAARLRLTGFAPWRVALAPDQIPASHTIDF